jgi:hypothetical protein
LIFKLIIVKLRGAKIGNNGFIEPDKKRDSRFGALILLNSQFSIFTNFGEFEVAKLKRAPVGLGNLEE